MQSDLKSNAGNRITLPNGRATTRLGFGCAYLLPETMHLVDVAYEAGIRHFDVAPAYGRGLTESLLGKALRTREDTTITTKFGIAPAFNTVGLAQIARAMLKPVVAAIPPLRKYVSSKVAARTAPVSLSADAAQQSLDRSRRNLCRDHIDILLLHEAKLEALRNPGLLPFLRTSTEAGAIGAFGVGGRRNNTVEIARELPEFAGVLQFDWSPIEEKPAQGTLQSIFYHTTAPAKLIRSLGHSGRIDLRGWSKIVGRDLEESTILEQLLLRLSMDLFPTALILFSSSKAEHIRLNEKTARDGTLSEFAARLNTLLTEFGLERLRKAASNDGRQADAIQSNAEKRN